MTRVEMVQKFYDEIDKEQTTSSGMVRAISRSAAGRLIDFIARMIMADLLLDGKSAYPGLGIFSVVERAPRSCINPKTGLSIGVKPAYKVIKFKPYKEIKETIRGT